jgi:hypothetical protein
MTAQSWLTASCSGSPTACPAGPTQQPLQLHPLDVSPAMSGISCAQGWLTGNKQHCLQQTTCIAADSCAAVRLQLAPHLQ